MLGSYPFPTYSGIFEPKHCKQIGPALWLFLWCVSSTTKEIQDEGITWGVVLGGKPVRVDELAETFGAHERTVRRWVDSLEDGGYIRVKRASNGIIFSVRNSKKFKDKIVRSDRAKMSDHEDGDRTKLSDQPDKNVRSNKDITEIYKAAVVVDENELYRLAQEVEAHFVQRRGRGFAVSPSDFEEIKRMIGDGIPVQLINDCIDRAFAEYRPRHSRDEIRSITYCVPRIYDEWDKLRSSPTDKPITGAVPHVPVAIGPPYRRKTQDGRSRQEQRNEIAKRKIMEAEERERSGSQEIILRHPEHL